MSLEIESTGPASLDPNAEQSMVPMRDGTRLATDFYLPPHPGRHPAVLVRLPYDKCGRYTFMPLLASCFTERGYAFVAQDVRGKFRSEGATMPYISEVTDGYDTLEWVATRSWSNGRVGMFGDSYYRFTRWAALASATRRSLPSCRG
jgi:putative CocE/NonD family hydrolase